MKFHWFNLMPWPHLPDDFTEKHRSVWVDVDSRLFDPVKANRIYNDYLDLLRFFFNHHRYARSDRPERVGKSPAELLSGKAYPHWLELLGFERFRQN